MTRAEFDVWIEQHYQDLVNVAVAVVGPRDAEDAVQSMLAGTLATRHYEKCRLDRNPVAWFTQNVRGYAASRRRSRERASVVHDEVEYLSGGSISGDRTKPSRAD